jgi:LytR cell envelope-related transcriptional attenuator
VDHLTELRAQQPWRSAAFIAAAVATVELAILLVVGIYFFGNFFADEVDKASDPVTVARAAVERGGSDGTGQSGGDKPEEPILKRERTSVLVLNGNGITGAASAAAEAVRARRYVIAGTGDAPRTDFPRSLIMYRPGFVREARRLAREVGVRRVTPLDGFRTRELQGAHVALIVGR